MKSINKYNQFYICHCNICDFSMMQFTKSNDFECFCDKLLPKINKRPKILLNPDYYRLCSIRKGIIDRCYNGNRHNYYNYGGRGIWITEEWRYNHLSFYYWAINNGYAPNLTIDRIDNDDGYYPENCRWATIKEQSNNRRDNKYIDFDGQTKTISQWADYLNLPYSKVYSYYKIGRFSDLFTN